MLKELKRVTHPARRAIAAAICPSIVSYSASGEDLLSWSWISALEPEPSKIRYLDIGAAHRSRLSNTFLFYARGSSGVLVEPDPDQAAALAAARPRDIIIDAGIAFDDRRSATLFKTTNPLFNSFSREQAESIVKQSQSWHPSQRQKIEGSIETKLVSANEILEEHFEGAPLHLLSIDAEGANFDIFRSIDFGRFSPMVICIEAQASIENHLRALGGAYRLIFQSPENFMFARGT
jgi:FkbM family methyltransferase